MNFLPLAFSAPWALAALATLPVIWWLLRFTPPRPREVAFPPLRLLLDLKRDDEKPQTSPWWLTALRLFLAALLILALAGPTLNPAPPAVGSGPLVLIVDNGWPAARGFEERRAAVDRVIGQAIEHRRPVLLIAAASGADQPFATVPAGSARERLRALEPAPFVPDRAELVPLLERALKELPEPAVIWFADDVANGNAQALAAALRAAVPANRIALYRDAALAPLVLGAPTNGADALSVPVQRPSAERAAEGTVRALDSRGRAIAAQPFALAQGTRESVLRFDLPVELRNEVLRLEIEAGGTAGAVQLLDDRWRRRTVGLVSGAVESESPLLSPLFFLGQALAPFADVRESSRPGTLGALGDFLDQRVSTIIMADVAAVPRDVHQRLDRWTRGGGVLVRFAGTRLAASQAQDPFVPVRLRDSTRILGGSLSWERPQAIARFSPNGPFAGLAVPADVTISRQILAEPEPGLAAKTWAELADGTPLVTAEPRGAGFVVLVHVTADPNWSNLPLSGTFLEMLRRMIALSAASGATSGGGEAARAGGAEPVLPPLRVLDATGRSAPPPASAKPIPVSQIANAAPSRDHPPGLYGREDAFRVLNALRASETVEPFPADLLPSGVAVFPYLHGSETALKSWLIAAALALLMLDGAIVLLLLGGGRMRRARPAAALVLLALAFALLASPADAQQRPAQPRATPPTTSSSAVLSAADQFALRAANQTRLAYVITGLADVDQISRAGLEGLTRVLNDRTSLEPSEPIGVDPTRDELAFFPMLYWPIDPRAPMPSAEAIARVADFMKNGGTVLFDTRDQGEARPSPRGGFDTPGLRRLREILASVDVPELEVVPPDHVMTKAFYLINAFPGRFEDGVLWTERTAPNPEGVERPVRLADGVTPILITTNDFAGAWASDARGGALLPLYGQNPRQRELAMRAGVNIMIYLLTGNYKADQVHVPDILRRLGQ